MHNKTYIADGHFAMLGGRNIGDRYFGLYEPFVQNDLDVLLAGEWSATSRRASIATGTASHSYPVALFRRSREALQDIAATETQAGSDARGRGRAAPSVPLPTADWGEFFEELDGTFAAGRAELSCRLAGYLERGPSEALSATSKRSLRARSARF